MRRTNPAAVLFVVSIVGALAASCSDNPPTTTDTTSTSSSSSSSTSTSGGGSGGSGGGSMAVHSGTETVNGGQFMRSGKYSMVYTMGQPSPNQSKISSDKYRMTGGIVGVTGSVP